MVDVGRRASSSNSKEHSPETRSRSTSKVTNSTGPFAENITIVTDSGTFMSKVANGSVSAEIHSPDETWMGCMSHFLNNVMKHSISTCNRDSTLQIDSADFRSMKRIVEDANRNGWNQCLPDVFTLILEVETRLRMHFSLAEMLLKSCSNVRSVLATRNRPQAYMAFQSIKKKTDSNSNIVGYPAVEAICYAFGIVMECIDRFRNVNEAYNAHRFINDIQSNATTRIGCQRLRCLAGQWNGNCPTLNSPETVTPQL